VVFIAFVVVAAPVLAQLDDYIAPPPFRPGGDSTASSGSSGSNAPVASNPSTSFTSIQQGETGTFLAKWSGNLGEYMFSTNDTGVWKNESPNFFVNNDVSSQEYQIKASPGSEVQWRFYASSDEDNWGETAIQKFTVSKGEDVQPQRPTRDRTRSRTRSTGDVPSTEGNDLSDGGTLSEDNSATLLSERGRISRSSSPGPSAPAGPGSTPPAPRPPGEELTGDSNEPIDGTKDTSTETISPPPSPGQKNPAPVGQATESLNDDFPKKKKKGSAFLWIILLTVFIGGGVLGVKKFKTMKVTTKLTPASTKNLTAGKPTVEQYINSMLSSGYEEGDIQERLMQSGYPERQVSQLLQVHDKPLKEYIHRMIALGFTKQQIQAELIKSGYTAMQAHQVFTNYGS
jgi:hypothetical protein